jgi:NAD(P)-dependent dehydrogenase (short-subunit alcohol dehydrogenase family)
MILFLASAEADFVTGATFSIDGGFVAGRSLES